MSGLDWTKYLTFFYYYTDGDPLSTGVDLAHLAILAAAAVALTVVSVVLFRDRDLRA